MKRLIASGATDTKSYKEKDVDYVTRMYVIDYLKRHNYGDLSRHAIKTIVDGILEWKRLCGICYHHADLNTDNNVTENILLIDRDAHSYLHQIANELKWFRHYDLVVPGYSQGPVAKNNELNMYQRLYADLDGGKSRYDANQIMDAIYDFLTDDSDRPYTSKSIYRVLISTDIYYVYKGQIELIIENSDVDFESDPGVVYIDDVTYKSLYPMLKSMRDANKKNSYAYHSYQTVMDFMDNNTLSRPEIRKHYNKNRFRR